MKQFLGLLLMTMLLISSCGPKPYFETTEGKKKLKHYNSIQFGQSKSR